MREELKNTKKLGNKGFSLIELIIVIAIMAILIGIVGTQVVPFLEKSREAKDGQVISSVLTSATTAFASNAATVDLPTGDTPQSFELFDDKVSDDMKKIQEDTLKLFNYKDLKTLQAALKSKAGKGITKITITRDSSGVVTVSTTSSVTGVFEDISST